MSDYVLVERRALPADIPATHRGHAPTRYVCGIVGHRWTDWRSHEMRDFAYQARRCRRCDALERERLMRVRLVVE